MKRVLVTGATGFIGRQCLPFLRQAGFEIHALSSVPVQGRDHVQWHVGDLLGDGVAAALVERVAPTHLLHLAWYAKPGLYWTAAENYSWVIASMKLLMAFADHGGRRAVLAGTCAEYDWRYGWCTEATTPLAYGSPYSSCKNSLRSLAESYLQQRDVGFSWGRIFFLYGPHEREQRLVASVIASLLRGQPALCTAGTQIRDFLHVADVAAAFVKLLQADQVQGAVNISSGRPVAISDVLRRIGVQLGRPELLHLGARPTPAGEPLFLAGDARRLADEVQWVPEYGLEQGIDSTVAWWREQLS